ncbi:hypothetical protein [Marivirga sp.]|uniref:hypothetical protein n=1 Tax=Marivirga sp. TaxID=2018662 RepID=UPI003DA6DF51
MKVELNLKYDDLIKVINQLPQEQMEKLLQSIKAEIKLKNDKKEKLRKFILKAPTWSEKEFSAYEEARNHINKTRLN